LCGEAFWKKTRAAQQMVALTKNDCSFMRSDPARAGALRLVQEVPR
jgi:hypothetical protein